MTRNIIMLKYKITYIILQALASKVYVSGSQSMVRERFSSGTCKNKNNKIK